MIRPRNQQSNHQRNLFKPSTKTSHNTSTKPSDNNNGRSTVARKGIVTNAIDGHDDGLRNVQCIRKRTFRIGGLMMLFLVMTGP
ncbi:MAG TPA: hypothetical protein DD982_02725 [Thalassospira sp.]|nr:hypothetical protein [Thalassospira sp.]OHY98071.1 hypothetical protein BC440_16870 [Thalassospira sp. MIT1004]HBS21428.1 hypothetical protein [Thalassospira sp.]